MQWRRVFCSVTRSTPVSLLREQHDKIWLYAGNPEYSDLPEIDHLHENGKNDQMQTIRREVVVDPSETTRRTLGVYITCYDRNKRNTKTKI